MRKKAPLPALFGLACLALSAPGAAGQAAASRIEVAGSPYTVASDIDWHRRVLRLRVSLDLAKAGLRLPEGRLAAERLVTRDLPGLAKDPLFGLPLDSRRSIGDSIADGTVDVSEILGLIDRFSREEAALSKDLGSFVTAWELPLGAVAALYVHERGAVPLPSLLDWKAAKAWSGIVIYADAPLPVHGERGLEDRLREGLFPRIWDSDMGLILDRSTVESSALAGWGPLAYATGLGPAEEERVGETPLLIRAAEVFGVRRTDLVISRADAEQILALPENRRLIAEGKVIVIIRRYSSGPGGDSGK